MNKGILSNIWKIYIIKTLGWFMVAMPIIVPFWKSIGLSIQEIIITQSVFSILIVLLEIPSGYFADIFGRKSSLIFAYIMLVIGYFSMSFAQDFTGVLIAEILLAFASSFISGADSAIVYDTLLEAGKEKDYKKIEGKIFAIGGFSESVASILGGLLAIISLQTPLIVNTIIFLLIIPVTLTLKEPKRHKYDLSEGKLKNMVSIIKHTLHEVPELKWITIYLAILNTSTLNMVWLTQPYFQLVGLPIFLFGIAWAVLNSSKGIFSILSSKVEKKLGIKNTLILLIFVSSLSTLALGLFPSIWIIFLFLSFYFVRGTVHPILRDFTNKLVTSEKRATVLSIQSMLGRLIYAVIGPFIGWTADIYSLETAFIISGITFLVLGFIPLYYLSKHKAL